MKLKCLFILAAALALTFTSCIWAPEEAKIETEDIRNDPRKASMYIDRAVHYGYNGHDYIMFIHLSGNSTIAGVVHDPDCHCFSENQDKEIKGLW